MNYPIRTDFYTATNSENDYGEVTKTQSLAFTTGTRPATVSFKDSLQAGISVDGERQYLFTRKSPITLSVKVGDQIKMPTVSAKTYSVIAIDPKLTNRAELMFLIDARD